MASDQTTAGSTICDLCSKLFDRRDLLVRHRRRCQGPAKPGIRRKACDACVAAKAKCCYNQPSCSRCIRRGLQCRYLNPKTASSDQSYRTSQIDSISSLQNSSTRETLRNLEGNGSVLPVADIYSSLEWNGLSVDLAFESWDHSHPESMPHLSMDLDSSIAQPLASKAFPALSPSTQTLPVGNLLIENSAPAMSPTIWDAAPSSSSSDSHNDSGSSTEPHMISRSLAGTICSYPFYLLKAMTPSLFLHQSLLSEPDSDVTSLPLTSMAICCAHMIRARDSNRFARRAMKSEQQRLIEAYPSYKCMQQWDALYAMLLHEILEMQEDLQDATEHWRLGSKRKGMRSPFLLKMTQCYARSYPQLRSHDIDVFLEPSSAPKCDGRSSWNRWKTTENARRMIFLVNMVNFLSNYDHRTGERLAYYEPLGDENILNMPLPCSHAAWAACDEGEWRYAMQICPPKTLSQLLPSGLDSAGRGAPSLPDSLQSLIANLSKDNLQGVLQQSPSFETSEALRALIVLCGFEQYA